MRSNLLVALLVGVLGIVPADAQRIKFRAAKPLPEGALPAAVDNSKLKFFPPVIDQLGGSCAQAAGIGYMFTYEMNRLLDRDASASADNRLSYQYAWNMVNDGQDQGGFVEQGLMLAKQYGMMTEADYGLHFLFKWATGYDRYLHAMRYRTEHIYEYDDSIPLMKRYLYDHGDGSSSGGILTFSGQSTGWTIDSHYDGPSLTGYHSLLTSLASDGSHAMTIVGYDDTVGYTDADGRRHDGAFIVVNSWGSWWQDDGRFYLPYDFFRDPQVKNLQLSNTVNGVSVTTYDPRVVLKLTIDYTSRDDLRYAVAATDDRQRRQPREQHFLQAFSNRGGDLPMRGPQFGSEIEIALDITKQAEAIAQPQQYFLNVIRSFGGTRKGEGRLVALSAIDYRSGQPVEYVCRDTLPVKLADGYNYFAVPLTPRFTVPASPLRYADATGNLSDDTYLIRTADGRHAKVRFSTPDAANQTITIRYETKE